MQVKGLLVVLILLVLYSLRRKPPEPESSEKMKAFAAQVYAQVELMNERQVAFEEEQARLRSKSDAFARRLDEFTGDEGVAESHQPGH